MSPAGPDAPRDPRATDEIWTQGPVWSRSERPLARLVAKPVQDFLRIESAGSIMLLVATVIALAWVNSPWGESYGEFWHTYFSISLGPWEIRETLGHWVNDALMAIFFFVVGMEIKHELVHGDLKDPKAAALPMIAAFGGVLVPAGIYALLNAGGDGAAGWGIPMATDIAFAVGVLGVLGRRIPSGARLFLLTLAVVDDIVAILVIAVFYTARLDLVALTVALVGVALVFALRRIRVWSRWVYVGLGLVVWTALLASGVHATLAGVALGLLTPAVPLVRERVARAYAQEALADRRLDPEEISRLRFLLSESVPMVEWLQARLHPLSSFVVLPLFALANAGVPLTRDAVTEAVTAPVGLGIIVGLVVGKPLGIVLFTWAAVRTGAGRLPEGTTWPMLVGLGSVAGIGFTVSIFIAGLSFPGAAALTDAAKVGIIGASLVSAVIGVLLLLAATRGRTPSDVEQNAS
ncbi:Na+/H+ antiporter NhaA [Nocardioides malaquae]|uniref:Na+/H+ antiporter NhaA n=1 Tax=Nocardioides malaquae TaxID=2773426 RepID=UPI0029D41A9E|nr:Na+/H+ antiporter NhaA [Nocardioides malaquae]